MNDDDLRAKLTQALSDAAAFGSPEDVADDVLPVVREALASARKDALKDAAIALYADVTAESGTTKALYNSIYAAWLLDVANNGVPTREDED